MRTNFDQLLEAGAHFGHLKRKWNPAMAPYIYMERNGIHIIDLNKTAVKIDEAAEALKNLARSGRKVLFVGTKKQAQEVVAAHAQEVAMPYITERWAGGMLTNFPTIRKAVKKMSQIDKMASDGTMDNMNLGSIADMTRLPSAVFVVDVIKEKIAVAEANRLGIPVFGIVDTNSNPNNIDFVIPANDDATKAIDVILTAVCDAIKEGLEERKVEKADEEAAEAQANTEAPAAHKERRQRIRKAAPKAEEKAEEPKAEEPKKQRRKLRSPKLKNPKQRTQSNNRKS